MASPIHGRRGRLYVAIASGGTAEPVANLNAWSLSAETDKVETTVFGDNNKTYVSGLPDASGDFSGFYDSGGAQTYTAASDGVARKFYLYPDATVAGTYWSGTAFFDFRIEGSTTDAVKLSGSWQAATAVTKTG